MLHKVKPGTDVIAITPQKKHGRVYYMGTVILTDARVRIDDDGRVFVLGEIIHEATEALEPTHKVRGRMERWSHKMGEVTAKGAYVVNGKIYVSKEVQA